MRSPSRPRHHLTPQEASAVLSLSASPDWAVFMGYLIRQQEHSRDRLEVSRGEDFRTEQGVARQLRDLIGITAKAEQVLAGQTRR